MAKKIKKSKEELGKEKQTEEPEEWLEFFKLTQDREIYSDDRGKLIGWEQKNNTVVLFAGAKESKHVEELDNISFPTEAVPSLIKFLQSIKLQKRRMKSGG